MAGNNITQSRTLLNAEINQVPVFSISVLPFFIYKMGLNYTCDFPGGPAVSFCVSTAGGMGLIPSGRAKIPRTL